MTRHVDDHELAAFRAATLTEKESARVRRHLESCEVCRERLDSVNVVAFARSQDRAREFAMTARRLERERHEAADVVRTLLRDTPSEEWPRLAEDERMRNSGALDQLAAEVRKRLATNPQEALALSTLATSIAETLPNDSYPAVVLAQIRATAWKDRAHVLKYLFRLPEAIDAIKRAEERLEGFASAAHDRAIVQLVRASILLESGATEEAFNEALAAREVFFEFGDMRRFLYAGTVVGNIHYDRGRYREASEIFARLLRVATDLGDFETQARLHNNLGYCATHLGDLPNANIHFSDAVRHFNDLGMHIEGTRTERGAGVRLLAKGDYAGGIRRLREARRQFKRVGLAEEAGRCGLDIAEALLERGENDTAGNLARELVDEFVVAGLNDRAITALEYLRQAIEHETASPATVRSVHHYLELLQTEPALEFEADQG